MLKALKHLIFAETDDAGKVSQISGDGHASLLVPVKAFDRASERAVRRCLAQTVGAVNDVQVLKVAKGVVSGSYYLVKVSFRA